MTSLPQGNLGSEAYQFVDFLKASGQAFWQTLPIQATCDHSPYNLASAFAGNPLFISQKKLQDKKGDQSSLSIFFEKNKTWLEDYALFSFLKRNNNNKPWNQWEEPLSKREESPLSQIKRKYREEIEGYYLEQYLFYSQWNKLRQYCHQNGIALLGDIPLYMAHDSADVWAHQEIFDLDKEGNPKALAGVPPDYFNIRGQLWGNPVYHWETLKNQLYRWWIDRLAFSLELFDVLRLDHFIGFVRYWRVPPDSRTAQQGEWVPGPGTHFFEKIFSVFKPQRFIAENLGFLTKEVEAVRIKFGLPGMKVFQFEDPHAIAKIPKETVLYTGTHDNDTLAGWLKSLDPSKKASLLEALGRDAPEICWKIIELAYKSPANTVIIPVQDILGLDSSARMNTPGTAQGNWLWRLQKGALNPAIAQRLKLLTEKSGRLPYN